MSDFDEEKDLNENDLIAAFDSDSLEDTALEDGHDEFGNPVTSDEEEDEDDEQDLAV